MSSISSATSSLGSLASYYAKLTAAQSGTDGDSDGTSVDATGTDTGMTAADVETLLGLGGSSDASSTSNLLSNTGSGALASLLGSTFTDTNSLLSQISALATGSSTTDGSTAGDGSAGDTSASSASTQQQLSSLIASMMQTEQQDSLSLFL